MPEAGNVDGKAGIAVWPVDGAGESFLAPFGLQAHLVPGPDLDAELVRPAGAWFAPAPGRYKLWLEGNGRMSPRPLVVNYSAPPFAGRGRVLALPLEPAGTVRLAPDVPVEPGQVLRLLRLEELTGTLHREVTRRVRGAAVRTGVLMPPGKVVAALHDGERGGYIALSAPAPVPAGGTTVVVPRPPRRGSGALIAVFEAPEAAASADDATVDLTLRTAGGDRSCDVLVPVLDRLYALWYELPTGDAVLAGQGRRFYLPETPVRLRDGRIEAIRGTLRPLPDLEVSVFLPQALMQGEVRLELRQPGRGTRRAQPVDAGQTGATFADLPPALTRVELAAGPWVFEERVDLSAGEDRHLVFEPAPIHIEGTVYRGDEPVSAGLRFILGRDEAERLEVEADEDGRYAVTLFRPGQYVAEITLRDEESAGLSPYLYRMREPLTVSGRYDFRVPGNSFVVEVRDAVSGGPVEGASIAVFNQGAGAEVAGQQVRTDVAGAAELPPLRAGELSLQVRAAGYRMATLEGVEIDGTPDERRLLPVALEPEGETWTLRLRMPSGLPLQGAAVVALSGDPPAGIAWSGTADAAGRVRVPVGRSGSYLAVKHPGSGFALLPWPAAVSRGEAFDWIVPDRAPSLTVRGLESDGARSPWAGVVLWLDGVRLQGAVLGWLTSTRAGSDGDGLWRVHNLPRGRSVGIALVGRGPGAEQRLAFATQTPVPRPWAGVLEVRVQ